MICLCTKLHIPGFVGHWCCCLIEILIVQSHGCDSNIWQSTNVMNIISNVYSSELRYDTNISSCQLCITLYCAFHCPADQTLLFFSTLVVTLEFRYSYQPCRSKWLKFPIPGQCTGSSSSSFMSQATSGDPIGFS